MPQRRQWQPTPVLLPGKSHGWRSLVGFSPWGRQESDMTERLHFHFSLSRTGEGNGNPLQCSCLENPRDSRAWWAAIYGIAQSRTRLKWLSREGKKNLTLVVCFLLQLKREIKNIWHLQPISSVWGPLAFLPVTLSCLASAENVWDITKMGTNDWQQREKKDQIIKRNWS